MMSANVNHESMDVKMTCHEFAEQYAGMKIQAVAVKSRAVNREKSSAESRRAVGHEREHLLLLVHEQQQREVPDALLREPLARDELEALHLAEVRWVPEHVDVQPVMEWQSNTRE